MSEKNIKVRLQQKHDTSANWALATNFKPKAGELIIYDDLKKMKVGDGETLVNNLPFLSADVSQDLNNYATLAGNNTFTGKNTFTYGSIDVSKTDSSNKTMKVTYGCNAIAYTSYGETRSNLISFPGKDGTFALTSDIPAAVSANPTLSGSEAELTGLQIGNTKYKIVTQTYVDTAIGNIDTLLTALNSGTGV